MKRTVIRGTAGAVLAGALGLGILIIGPTPKAQAKHGCSVDTLDGDYLFTVRADTPSYAQQAGFPFVAAGVRTFDGAGNMSQLATASAGGTILSRSLLHGTYTLGADCTGTMTIAGVRNFDIFVKPDGSEGLAVQTDNGTVQTQTFKRQ